jgi:DNA-binding NarL/FixJ family response regulator
MCWRRETVIRVAVAEGQHLVRQGICALLDSVPGIKVVGEAANGLDAVELVGELAPDVLIMNVTLPRLSGNLAAGRIRALGSPTRVIMLSQYADGVLVRRALANGASGYLLKGSRVGELVSAIRAVCRGEIYVSPSLSQTGDVNYSDGTLRGEPSSSSQDLTPREREVLQLIADGLTNAAVAERMGVTVKTVEKHRANLMTKLDVHDSPSLIRVAVRYQLLFADG